jgi:hypothetical protein
MCEHIPCDGFIDHHGVEILMTLAAFMTIVLAIRWVTQEVVGRWQHEIRALRKLGRIEKGTHIEMEEIPEERISSSRFMNWLVNEVRVDMHGTPKYTQANLLVVNRRLAQKIQTEKPTIRGAHLQWLVENCAPLVFIPTKNEVMFSKLLVTTNDSLARAIEKHNEETKDSLFLPANRMRERLAAPQ